MMKIKRYIGGGLAVLLLGGCLLWFGRLPGEMQGRGIGSITVLAANSSSSLADSIKDKENQISQAQKEKENLQNGLSDMKKMKEELEAQKSNLANYVTKLDKNLAVIEQRIAELKQQIQTKEAEITQTEAELEAAIEIETGQYEMMKSRIRSIYEANNNSYLGLLLNAESFGELLNRTDYIQSLYAYDRRVMNEYQMNRKYVELCKQQLALEKELLDEQKAMVDEEQKNLENLIGQKKREITSYQTDINNKEQAIAEYESEIKAQNEMIAALEAQVAEEKRKQLEANGNVIKYDGGVFKFPMASHNGVSDDYGMRIHPILGVSQFHNGVDFRAPAGTAIYAAYDGKVVAATYSSTMGNYVMIDHGDGLYTIYMHASALYVSRDDIVIKGETIAAVGSTGRSTGNHLHFSVRLNGEYVSPWNYLSA